MRRFCILNLDPLCAVAAQGFAICTAEDALGLLGSVPRTSGTDETQKRSKNAHEVLDVLAKVRESINVISTWVTAIALVINLRVPWVLLPLIGIGVLTLTHFGSMKTPPPDFLVAITFWSCYAYAEVRGMLKPPRINCHEHGIAIRANGNLQDTWTCL